MMKNYNNPCIRCGKERIISKTWQEKVESLYTKSIDIVEHTEWVCPDKNCQEIVEEQLAKVKKETERVKREREERSLANKLSLAQKQKNIS